MQKKQSGLSFHTKMSFIKSGMRISGYLSLLLLGMMMLPATIILIVAEVLGIVEEFENL
jgi:hypothetical protein